MDVTISADRGRLLEEVEQHLGGLSILVNNAGANWGAPLAEYPDEGFEKVISTNLNAVFALTRISTLVKKYATTDNLPELLISDPWMVCMCPLFREFRPLPIQPAKQHCII